MLGTVLNNAAGSVTLQMGYGANGTQLETFDTLNVASGTYAPVSILVDDYALRTSAFTLGTPVTFDFYLTAGAAPTFVVAADGIQIMAEETLT